MYILHAIIFPWPLTIICVFTFLFWLSWLFDNFSFDVSTNYYFENGNIMISCKERFNYSDDQFSQKLQVWCQGTKHTDWLPHRRSTKKSWSKVDPKSESEDKKSLLGKSVSKQLKKLRFSILSVIYYLLVILKIHCSVDLSLLQKAS